VLSPHGEEQDGVLRHQCPTGGDHGARERRRLELSPVEWIRQPPGYMMVPLTVTVSANGVRLVGSIRSSGCSNFEVRLR
jgi:hypothetical protein